MKRIMVLNAKGGCGKTLIATNLASYYASQGMRVTLMDRDPIGSATFWLNQRDEPLPPIYLINSTKPVSGMTRSWAMRIPRETERLIIDTPAGVNGQELDALLNMADLFLVPVLPSSTDIHAVSRFIAELLIEAQFRQRGNKLAVIANRVHTNTKSYTNLRRFLKRLDYPLVTTLRDTQKYLHTSAEGIGIFEAAPQASYQRDIDMWQPLIQWTEGQTPNPTQPRTTRHKPHSADSIIKPFH